MAQQPPTALPLRGARHRQLFTAREAAVKLGVDAKTLRAWRRCPLCNIKPTESPADARLALYTLDELKLIARNHHRTLRDDDAVAREAHSPSRRELISRLEEAERKLSYAMSLLGQSPRARALALLSAPASALAGQPAQQPVADGDQLIADRAPAHTPRQARLPLLPGGLVPWRAMARHHGIPETTVAKAVDALRLPVVAGHWLLGRSIVLQALDADGQARFYELWSRSPRFVPCELCPHDAAMQPPMSVGQSPYPLFP